MARRHTSLGRARGEIDSERIVAHMKEISALGVQAFVRDVVRRGGKATKVAGSGRGAVKVWGKEGGVSIVQVRAKASGDWHASRRDEEVGAGAANPTFWAFVDLGTDPHATYIISAEEFAADVRCEVDAWMADRPGRSRSGGIRIAQDRIAHRRARWDLLGVSVVADANIDTTHLDDLTVEKKKAPAKAAAVEDESDGRTRLVADFEGYRIVALREESTGRLEIVAGQMVGRHFPTASAAASAVASLVSGEKVTKDGADFWRAEG